MISIGDKAEPIALTLIAGEREHLVAPQHGDLLASVMRNGELPHAGGEHAIRGDDRSVATKESDDDSHCWKMLFAFISG